MYFVGVDLAWAFAIRPVSPLSIGTACPHTRPRPGSAVEGHTARHRGLAAATVALFGPPRTLKYKAKPGRDLDGLKSEMMLLMDCVEALARSAVPLRVTAHQGWVALRRHVIAAQRKSDLRRAEDPIDAVVCAYVALYAERCPAKVTTYGDAATGYMVTPSLPA